jgi:hypothetical protein
MLRGARGAMRRLRVVVEDAVEAELEVADLHALARHALHRRRGQELDRPALLLLVRRADAGAHAHADPLGGHRDAPTDFASSERLQQRRRALVRR